MSGLEPLPSVCNERTSSNSRSISMFNMSVQCVNYSMAEKPIKRQKTVTNYTNNINITSCLFLYCYREGHELFFLNILTRFMLLDSLYFIYFFTPQRPLFEAYITGICFMRTEPSEHGTPVLTITPRNTPDTC